ncbi:hypothetical protein QLY92_20930, partial [Cronobacter dublinensis]|nr:hypothetical protein [Cronobacter dublinensis]
MIFGSACCGSGLAATHSAALSAAPDGEMAQRAKAAAANAGDDWATLLAEGVAYIRMALDEEVRRIVLLDGPAFLGDPAQWPS